MSRRQHVLTALHVFGCSLVLIAAGCNSAFLSQDPVAADLDQVLPDIAEVTLIRDVSSQAGMNPQKIEGVGLCTRLQGTGSNPAPSSFRTMLINDIQTYNVSPLKMLADKSTSLVLVRGMLPPGIQEGESFDLEVWVPKGSTTTSLHGGWLMPSRLRDMQILDNELHMGRVVGRARGNVIADAAFEGDGTERDYQRATVLGGGISQTSRKLGVVLHEDDASLRMSSLIGTAINRRFYRSVRGDNVGVAKPLRPNYVELELHPRYKHNVYHYMRVVRNIAINEKPAQRAERMELLRRQLADRISASRAAVQLEAIGRPAVDVLKGALESPDAEVRFYAAQSLAYLDEEACVPVLFESARDEPAFRWHALKGLQSVSHISSYDALSELLHVPSAEARYGAFESLLQRNPADPLVQGDVLGEPIGMAIHEIGSTADPLVHVSKQGRAEVILFGQSQQIRPASFMFVGKNILIKSVGPERLRVSRFRAGDDGDEVVECTSDLAEVIRAIVQLGGGYGDVVETLCAAKEDGILASRLAIDARPRSGRTYHRQPQAENTGPSVADVRAGQDETLEDTNVQELERDTAFDSASGEEKESGFFGRMRDWF